MLVTLKMHATHAAETRLPKLRLLNLNLGIYLQWSVFKEHRDLILVGGRDAHYL